jgi:hypothetical protein
MRDGSSRDKRSTIVSNASSSQSGRYVSSELVSPLKQSNFCLPPTGTGAERIRFLTGLPNKGEEVQMMAALLSLGLLGAQPVSNRMPEVKVDALCKAGSADAKLMRLAETRTCYFAPY